MTYLLILGLIVFGVWVWASQQPDNFRVDRSIAIAAPAESAFQQVNNLKLFNEWNPWGKIDPNSKVTFEGPDEGVGAKMSWEGNMQVGKGSMTNTGIRLNEFIQFRMEFIKPMQGNNTAEFTFRPDGGNTAVTWSIYGKQSFGCKLMGLVMSTDKMIGTQFEKGLADLKARLETK